MTTQEILSTFREKVSQEVDIASEGIDRHVVYTPFSFDDGDHFVITLCKRNGQWVLSDEGHTLMHLSYEDVDITKGQRAAFLEEALARHGVGNRAGELELVVPGEAFGDALFSFVQALTKVSTVTDWTQTRVRSTFWEDFQSLVEGLVPEGLRHFKYRDPDLDPDGIYPIDCYIRAPGKPCHVYAVGTDSQCQNATISIMFYERADRTFTSLALFEDQAAVNRRAVAQLSDVVSRQFASLGPRDRIGRYVKEEVLGEAA